LNLLLLGALPLAAALPSVALSRDWRIIVASLGLFFIGCSFVEAAFAGPVVGAARCLAGESVVVALLMAKLARRGRPRLASSPLTVSRASAKEDGKAVRAPFDDVFQFFLLVLSLVAAFAMSQVIPLGWGTSSESALASFFVYWMATAGLLVVMYSRDPLRVSTGLIVLLSAGNLLHSALAGPSLATLLASGAVCLIVAAAVGRLELIR